MKKTTIIGKLEKCIDKTLESLYDARDVLEEVEDIELDQLMNEIVEDLECDVADKVELLRERIDKIFE
tara:strand:+ start:14007 stop:14210 length:204 start_codon:yes stop_codon:yes gene_type:complete